MSDLEGVLFLLVFIALVVGGPVAMALHAERQAGELRKLRDEARRRDAELDRSTKKGGAE